MKQLYGSALQLAGEPQQTITRSFANAFSDLLGLLVGDR